MKTTVDLPEALLHRAKIIAAQRKTTLKKLILIGLDWAIRSGSEAQVSEFPIALSRLRNGLRLGGQPLTRDQTHERN